MIEVDISTLGADQRSEERGGLEEGGAGPSGEVRMYLQARAMIYMVIRSLSV